HPPKETAVPSTPVPPSSAFRDGRSPWQAIDRLAASQHGIVTVDELRTIGLSPSAIQRAARSGRLDRLHRGVYRMPGSPPVAPAGPRGGGRSHLTLVGGGAPIRLRAVERRRAAVPSRRGH